MQITRRYTAAGMDPFAGFHFVPRTSRIANPDGSVTFSRTSPLALFPAPLARFPRRVSRPPPFPLSGGHRRGPRFTIHQSCSPIPCGMANERTLTLDEVAGARGELRAIADELEFVQAQLARLPTRKEEARNTLGIIFAMAMLTTLAVLWLTGSWHNCLW